MLNIFFLRTQREGPSGYGIGITRNTTSGIFVIFGVVLAICSGPLPVVSSKGAYTYGKAELLSFTLRTACSAIPLVSERFRG